MQSCNNKSKYKASKMKRLQGMVRSGLLGRTLVFIKGATREGAKGAEAPPLSKSKLRKRIKYRIVLTFLCLGDL